MMSMLACCHKPRFYLVLSVALLLGACSNADEDVSNENIADSGGMESTENGAEQGNNNAGTDPDAISPGVVPSMSTEPVPEASEFNNAIGFDIYREAYPRLPDVAVAQDVVGEQEFAAGLPAAVVTAPSGLDTSGNQPPFFSDLQNMDVFAGESVQIRFKPEDPDGNLPGMFPQKLPLGASFDDNRDGSKTFSWQPLQEDVGILRFTVIALDFVEPEYRTAQSVLIRVSMPDDPSTIPNKAPMLEPTRDYTIKVNAPAVVELKGLDLNGTVPTLEIPALPAGGSFRQHPRFEEIYVLKFTPVAAGDFTFDVVARDSVDATLSTTQSVTIQVRDVPEFAGVGVPLRELASAIDKQIGFAALQSFYHQPDGVVYADTAAREFNIVTPENSMKMDTINPLPGRYEFAATDNLVRYAKLHGMRLHAHPLIWYRQLPQWIESSDVSDREQHMLEFIDRIMLRYADDIDLWDVINEPVNDDGSLRNSVWFEAMGEQYIDKAMNRARQLAPTATLLINEFDIGKSGPKFDGLLALVERLQQRGVALDGIGFQMHVFSDFSTLDELRNNFEAVAALGLDVYITEFDVSIAGEVTEQALQQQADVYGQVAALCVEQPACKALQMWGFTDQYSFRSNFSPLPFDRNYQIKPAYQALQNSLSGGAQLVE